MGVLIAIFQIGHALSMESSCSVKDIQICNTCKNIQCEVHGDNYIGSFENVFSFDECQDWCKIRNDYMGDCQYMTYFGNKGQYVQNTCYIFRSCVEKTECKDCVTETFDCFCSSSVMPSIEGTKRLDRFDGIISEGECRQKCRHNTRCEFYTYMADSQKCLLLAQLIEPFHDCNGCRTGKANCTEAPMTTSNTPETTSAATTASTSFKTHSTSFTRTTTKPTSTTSNTSTTHTTRHTTTTTTPSNDCRDFTVNHCNFEENSLIKTTFGEVDTFCDTLCTVTMADACRFFVYDYINRQCDLYGTEASADISSYCNEEGGPAVPELAKCAPR